MEIESHHPDESLRMFAKALYEIRILLSGYLGSENPGDMSVRQAAHLAYAFHNQADAVIEGRPVDLKNAISRLGAVDSMLGSNFTALFNYHPPA